MKPRLLVALVLVFPSLAQQEPSAEDNRIRQLVADYAAAVDAADIRLAAQVWDTSPDVSFIHPLGEAHGWAEVNPSSPMSWAECFPGAS